MNRSGFISNAAPSLGKRFRPIALSFLATIAFAGQVSAQTIYTETSVESLVDHQIQDPSDLVGRFIYLGQRNGMCVFSTFSQTSNGIVFGKVLIAVKFADAPPPGLGVGKTIVSTPDNPLTITSVIRSQEFIFVKASAK